MNQIASLQSTLVQWYTSLNTNDQFHAGLIVLCTLAILTRFIVQVILLRVVRVTRRAMASPWAAIVLHDNVLVRVAKIAPSVTIQLGIHWVAHLETTPKMAIANLAAAFTAWHVMQAVITLFNEMGAAHLRGEGSAFIRNSSIKSYVQLGKLLSWVVGTLVIAAALMNKSPLVLLSGLGAMSAVLMLVFKDTILSFVAGIQMSTYDMLRVGDWIEMPQVGADGSVVDIGLHTVKVQNWDKTMTTIPTWRLASDSFKNWRAMFESGGRRIMRNLNIDAATVHLLTDEERAHLSNTPLLRPYWDAREGLKAHPEAAARALPVQAIAPHMVTNLAAFKAYTRAYLVAHPRINLGPDMFMLVRTMEPTALGIPLQLYCFTATTAWAEYEDIQGEIIDHLIGVMPLFGLALYQRSSDRAEEPISAHPALLGESAAPAAQRHSQNPALAQERT